MSACGKSKVKGYLFVVSQARKRVMDAHTHHNVMNDAIIIGKYLRMALTVLASR